MILVTIALGALAARHRTERPPEAPIVLAPPTETPRGPLDLNHADAAALEALPRIGPSLARRIIEDRETRGPFQDVDDLDRVRGIGPATIDVVRPLVIAGPPEVPIP